MSAPEAATLIEIMNDPQKRAAFALALQALATPLPVTSPGGNKAPAASITAAIAASANASATPVVKLAPNSVGAQVISQTSAFWNGLELSVINAQHHLAGWQEAFGFVRQTLANGNQRGGFLRYLLTSLSGLVAAVSTDCGFVYLLRLPRRALSDLAPARARQPRKWKVRIKETIALTLVGGADFAVACLTIVAGMVAGLIVVGLFRPGFGDSPVESCEFVIFCYGAARLGSALVAVVTAPRAPRLRLISCGDDMAGYLMRASLSVLLIGGLGYAFVELLVAAGLPDNAEAALVKTVLFAVALTLIVVVLQCRAAVTHWLREGADPSRLGGRVRLLSAPLWHRIAILAIAGIWLSAALTLRHSFWHLAILAIFTGAIVLIARALSHAAQRGLERGLSGSSTWPGYDFDLEARLRRWQGILRSLIQLIAFLAAAAGIALIWGYDVRTAFRSQALGANLLSASTTIILTAFLTITSYEIINALAERKITRHMRDAKFAAAARLRTLLPIMHTVLTLVLGSVFALTALNEIGINTAPILAGAGIIGVAIGFGSQKLVQDFITGIFLLFENAMQVGDYVTVAGLAGTVEALSIRTMRLRALDGSVHLVPFSAVTTVTNVHRGLGNAAISISVAAETDIDRIFAILQEIATSMRTDPPFGEMIHSDLTLYGVDKIEAGIVTITGQIGCTDTGRWPVQREFNRRLATRLARDGIRISAPIQTVFNISSGSDRAEPDEGDAV